MKKIFTLKILLVLALLLSVAKLNAQVSIGADVAPQPFSVLELYAKYKTDPVDTYGGLRMPQLDTVQRNALSRTYGTDPAFFGLTIYNTNNNCLEYWNSTKWVSLCLGTADIWLEGDNCTYDPSTPIPNDAEPCTYTPMEEPPCSVTPNPFQIDLIVGFGYASINVEDDFTSSFTVNFNENNTAFPRLAIVRVTSNCTGEFKDFIFRQAGGECPDCNPFTVATNTTTLCGNSGGVQAWVVNPDDECTYIWAFNGGVVHEGKSYQITRHGTYTVYGGLLGCTNPTPQVIEITQTLPGTSPTPPWVFVENDGIICPGGSVTLHALGATLPVQWYQIDPTTGAMILYNSVYSDGTPGPPSANPLTVSESSAAGEWFATQGNPCGSRRSNIVHVSIAPGGIITLPDPIFTINGTLHNNNPQVCKNSSIELVIVNHSAFPTGTEFRWFFNYILIATSYDSIFSRTSSDLSTLTICVEAHLSGYCPATSSTDGIPVTIFAPPPPVITPSTGYICGTDPAILMTDRPGYYHEWVTNNLGWFIGTPYTKLDEHTRRLDVTSPGFYAARYLNSCWSDLSAAAQVIESNYLTSDWIAGRDTGIVGTTALFAVNPESAGYFWESSNNSVATVSSMLPTATVHFVGLGTATITVHATNNCGMVSVSRPVVVIPGCINVVSVNLTPNTEQIRELDVANTPKPGHESTDFIATRNPSAAVVTYVWKYRMVSPTIGSETTVTPPCTTNACTFPTPTTPGVYEVWVEATDNCIPPVTRASARTRVRVEKDCLDDFSGNYRITGPKCYDVRQTAGDDINDCMPLGGRINSFRKGATPAFDFSRYQFVANAGSPYSNVTFTVEDPETVLRSPRITGSGNTATLYFRTDIENHARTRTKDNPMQVTIIARFDIAPGQCRQISYVVNVQDCSCGCEVRSTLPAGWLTFLCYNLGVPGSTGNLNITQQRQYTPLSSTDSTIYGGLYQWGRINDGHQMRTSANVAGPVSLGNYNTTTGQANPGSNFYGRFVTRASGTQDWLSVNMPSLWNSGTEAAPVKTVNDPCPSGWRIPTTTEWQSIVNGNSSNSATISATGTLTASGNTWYRHTTGGTRGFTVSPDGGTTITLFLPYAGIRGSATGGGALNHANAQGCYWSSTATGTTQAFMFYFVSTIDPTYANGRYLGRALRCVEE